MRKHKVPLFYLSITLFTQGGMIYFIKYMYKFVLIGSRYSFLEKTFFIWQHIVVIVFFTTLILGIITHVELKILYSVLAFISGLFFSGLRAFYIKFTDAYDKEYFSKNKMTKKQEEFLEIKMKILGTLDEVEPDGLTHHK